MIFDDWWRSTGLDKEKDSVVYDLCETAWEEGWVIAWKNALLREAEATDRLLQAADRDLTYMRKRMAFMERRLIDLQGHEDLDWIDKEMFK